MPRYDRLPDGQRIRCYVAPRSAPFMDRWLVLFEDDPDPLTGDPVRPYGPRAALSMSDNPDHPQGVSMMSAARPPLTYGPKYDPGEVRFRRVAFAELPENIRAHVISRATLED